MLQILHVVPGFTWYSEGALALSVSKMWEGERCIILMNA